MSRAKDDIPVERLRELLDYDPETGVLTWRAARGKRFCGVEAGVRSVECRTYYKRVKIDQKGRYTHRLAWALYYGRYPQGEIDHKDGNGLNNRINNLREATSSQNNQNRRASKGTASGVVGVSWHKGGQRWQAHIKVSGEYRYLGCFVDKQDAIAARRAAESELFGEFKPSSQAQA